MKFEIILVIKLIKLSEKCYYDKEITIKILINISLISVMRRSNFEIEKCSSQSPNAGVLCCQPNTLSAGTRV